jgi:hypothetical protein
LICAIAAELLAGRHQKGGCERRHRAVANRPKAVGVQSAANFAVMRLPAICGGKLFPGRANWRAA